MNAVALVLCSLIAGADARETIADTPTLHSLLDRIYLLDSSNRITVQEAGELLKVTLGLASPDQTIDYHIADGCRVMFEAGEYQLRVVPIAGAPNCLIAGYVKKGVARQDYLKVVCSVYIDVEKNFVLSLERPQERKLLTQADDPAAIANLAAALEQMAAAFDGEPSAAIGGDAYVQFENQFFSPPAITTTATARIEKLQERKAELALHFTAEGRSAVAAREVLIKSVLESNLAIPANEFFGTPMAPTTEKE